MYDVAVLAVAHCKMTRSTATIKIEFFSNIKNNFYNKISSLSHSL
jgi:hypothetical protein